MSPAHDTMPVPCRRCGAPMSEEPPDPHAHHAATAVIVSCAHCGAREQLPADAAARVSALRRRLQEIRWAQQALEGPVVAVARIAEHYPKMIAPGVLFVVAVSCLGGAATLAHAFELPATGSIRVVTLLSALTYPVQVGLLMASVFGATILALRAYARELRPLLEARPAQHAGAYRCRGCGGPIETRGHEGAFVACAYCGAQNLLGARSAEHRAAQLARELEEYRERARGARPRLVAALDRYKQRLQLAMGAIVVVNVLCSFGLVGVQQLIAFAMR